MRVFVTSTPEQLQAHRRVVYDTIGSLGWEAVPPFGSTDWSNDSLKDRERRVLESDLVLTLLGRRSGDGPEPEKGGDGIRGWVQWEVRAALLHSLPMVVFSAGPEWPEEAWEEDPVRLAVLEDLRAELARIASDFGPQVTAGGPFETRLRRALARYRPTSWMATASRQIAPGLRLRRFPSLPCPERPFPLLLPYTHPALLAGRDRDVDELSGLLGWPSPILGVHAPSGAGKSSLLAAGLVASLRADERPVALEQHPAEPGIARRLLDELLESGVGIGDTNVPGFADRTFDIARLARSAPVLVIDQFEDVLGEEDESASPSSSKRRARAILGPLLAATVQRQPGFSGPACRWILAYRREYHGAVLTWLEDVLREARQDGSVGSNQLPHDLSRSDRFHSWAMPVLGGPPPGSTDPRALAQAIFYEAIDRPLSLKDPSGEPVYPWRFADGAAARLADAFADARVAQPTASLGPELQVVIAQLLEEAGEPLPGETITIEVGEDPENLIERALERHLARALATAFPTRKEGRTSASARLARTRALLSLRELAELRGLRRDGIDAETLAKAIGQDGHEVFERLATDRTRLVVPLATDSGHRYRLSHDRLAEVLVRVVDGDGQLGDLEIDRELLTLHRFVVLRSQLFAGGEQEAAIADVPSTSASRIKDNEETLLCNQKRRDWWGACQVQQDRKHRRRRQRILTVAASVVALTVATWFGASRRAERMALIERVEQGEAAVAFSALSTLASRGVDPSSLRTSFRSRKQPSEVLELGLDSKQEPFRAEAVLRVVEVLMPIVESGPLDVRLTASLLWALDYSPIRQPGSAEAAAAFRSRLLTGVSRAQGPPSPSPPGTPYWIEVPPGEFLMGSSLEEGRTDQHMTDERPQHTVRLDGFRILDHEVTHGELRDLWPEHLGPENLPAEVSWYEAYLFAAWLGGRLPTEAEWEYAARADCHFSYCDRRGNEATIGEVAWWFDNSRDEETGEPEPQPVRQLEPNPWGLYDMPGNVSEWVQDWYGPYSAGSQVNPMGPSAGEVRINRGHFHGQTTLWVHPKARGGSRPTSLRGFRVRLPA